jgi:hypothetical protein
MDAVCGIAGWIPEYMVWFIGRVREWCCPLNMAFGAGFQIPSAWVDVFD